MPAVVDIAVVVHPQGEGPHRESFTGGPADAAAWLRTFADELDANHTDVITKVEPPEQAACRTRSVDEETKLKSLQWSDITGPPDPRGMDCAVAKRTGFACVDHRWHALNEHIIPFDER